MNLVRPVCVVCIGRGAIVPCGGPPRSSERRQDFRGGVGALASLVMRLSDGLRLFVATPAVAATVLAISIRLVDSYNTDGAGRANCDGPSDPAIESERSRP